MGDVVKGAFSPTLDVPVQDVLAGAADLQTVMVAGFKDGSFEMFSSIGDSAQILLILELAKRRLLQDVYD